MKDHVNKKLRLTNLAVHTKSEVSKQEEILFSENNFCLTICSDDLAATCSNTTHHR
jgi:hypothetical protein